MVLLTDHGPGQAHGTSICEYAEENFTISPLGLSFSVPLGVPIPPSLHNVRDPECSVNTPEFTFYFNYILDLQRNQGRISLVRTSEAWVRYSFRK